MMAVLTRNAIKPQINVYHRYLGHQSQETRQDATHIIATTAVRLKVEENQLVGVFGEIGVRVDGLKSA
jgi:hypothetical protein